ncbi:hypothetical protein [uncultured Sphingomonas sp.]|uniref:hypothetical protein n=1 Tax=uncultured Sphingomonas sp. TaxID=158754 RepID=UPI0025DBD883|nr:hypothetical protein [uncultured Sphingomonas sp.]
MKKSLADTLARLALPPTMRIDEIEIMPPLGADPATTPGTVPFLDPDCIDVRVMGSGLSPTLHPIAIFQGIRTFHGTPDEIAAALAPAVSIQKSRHEAALAIGQPGGASVDRIGHIVVDRLLLERAPHLPDSVRRAVAEMPASTINASHRRYSTDEVEFADGLTAGEPPRARCEVCERWGSYLGDYMRIDDLVIPETMLAAMDGRRAGEVVDRTTIDEGYAALLDRRIVLAQMSQAASARLLLHFDADWVPISAKPTGTGTAIDG